VHIEQIINKDHLRDPNRGFTLVELVIVLVLTSILAGSMSVFMSYPILAYTNILHRAELVDSAELALRRIVRDIERAVPNSVRVKTSGSTVAIEMLNAVDGARYRAQPPGNPLNFSGTTTGFDIIGNFQAATSLTPPAGGFRLVIYNIGAYSGTPDSPVAGENVYSLSGAAGPNPPAGSVVITPTTSAVALVSGVPNDSVTITPGIQFAFASPENRLYVADTPVTYICSPNPANPSQGTLYRYHSYSITQVQSTSAPIGSTSAQVAKNVSACSFNYAPGAPQRNGIVTLNLTLTKRGESSVLLLQSQVNNSP